MLTVPEMDRIVPLLEEWTAEVRSGFGVDGHPALWVTEHCGRISLRRLDAAHAIYRTVAINRHRMPGGTAACALPRITG